MLIHLKPEFIAILLSSWTFYKILYPLILPYIPEPTPPVGRYSYPGQNLIFDRYSYQEDRRMFVVCDEEPIQPRGNGSQKFIRCEVNHENLKGRKHECPITLTMSHQGVGVIRPGSMQVRPFGEDKAILSWVDPTVSVTSPNKWRLFVVHLSDCSLYEAQAKQLKHLRPVNFVVYENWFIAIVSSEKRGTKCYHEPLQMFDVPRCWVGFNDRLDISAGPFFWFKQNLRDDRMIVAPLRDDDPASGHLLIQAVGLLGMLITRVSIVPQSGEAVLLRSYEFRLDTVAIEREFEQYSERIVAYSTSHDRIGVCARITFAPGENRLRCTQWDHRGRRLETDLIIPVKYRHPGEIALLNLPGQEGMLFLEAECGDASCSGAGGGSEGKSRYFVSKIYARDMENRSHVYDKYECAGRYDRADAQLFQRGPPGHYCISQICYEDFLEADDFGNRSYEDRSRRFKFHTQCFFDSLGKESYFLYFKRFFNLLKDQGHEGIIYEGHKNFACNECEKKFNDPRNLLRHQKQVHEGRKDYECYNCEKKFGHKSTLVFHQKTIHRGSKDYACDKCEKKYVRKQYLLDHHRTVHEGRKDYTCDQCEQKFGSKSNVWKHQKTVHEGRKDYLCDKCKKKFGLKSDLLKHRRTVHEGRKDFVCDKCEKKFAQKPHLLLHQKTVHEGRKDFACNKCEKTFGQKSTLLIHRKTVHEGRKDYTCDKCEQKFGSKSNVWKHQKTVHEGRKDYLCDKCKKKFGLKSDLLKHRRTVHEGRKDFVCDNQLIPKMYELYVSVDFAFNQSTAHTRYLRSAHQVNKGQLIVGLFLGKAIYNYLYSGVFVVPTESITTSPVQYSYPGRNLIFDRYSYQNDSRVFVVCDEEPIQPQGNGSRKFLKCEVYHDDPAGRRHECPITLTMSRRSAGVIRPGSMQVRPFGEDKAILSWVDPTVPVTSPNKWRLFVVHLSDCSLYEAQAKQLKHLRPVNFVVYENWFVAIVSSEKRGTKCYHEPLQMFDVPRCWVGFNDRLDISAGPFFWFKQDLRDDRMIVAPLRDNDPASGQLLIEIFSWNGHLHAGASIVQHNGTRLKLGYFVLMDARQSRAFDPHDRIAYSTSQGRVGICAKIWTEPGRHEVNCAQWDWRGQQQMNNVTVAPFQHVNEIALLNLPEDQGMLVVAAECEDASCVGENRRHHVGKIDRYGRDSNDLTHRFDKYECDGRINRADSRFFLHGSRGNYCISQVCYEDFFVHDFKNPFQNRTREFKFNTRCFYQPQLFRGP
ncbi:unnamed protein product [Trichogramma brassicae]|uniref:C2H2-type domain-containing protein n=1 Tax=Trichogramma brassicae TaxID=86971 RepID=A0A6H5J1S3_9HYME|nr:unnamed protein product [Trichogramma brassicae]